MPTPSLVLPFEQGLVPKGLEVSFEAGSRASRINEEGRLEITGPGQARLDYDPVSGRCRGLLVEPERRNHLKYSFDFTQPEWIKSNVDLAQEDTILGQPAYTITDNSFDGAHKMYRTGDPPNGYTFSLYVKPKTARYIGFAASGARSGQDSFGSRWAIFDLQEKTVQAEKSFVNARVEEVTDEVVRLIADGTGYTGGDPNGHGVAIAIGSGPENNDFEYAGDGSLSATIMGAQMEKRNGGHASTLIPTTGEAVTRKETVRVPSPSTDGTNTAYIKLTSDQNGQTAGASPVGDKTGFHALSLGRANLWYIPGKGAVAATTGETSEQYVNGVHVASVPTTGGAEEETMTFRPKVTTRVQSAKVYDTALPAKELRQLSLTGPEEPVPGPGYGFSSYPITDAGWFQFAAEDATGEPFKVIVETGGIEMRADWKDGSPLETGSSLSHVYDAGTDIRDATIIIPDNTSPLSRLKIMNTNGAKDADGNKVSDGRIYLDDTFLTAIETEDFEVKGFHGKLTGEMKAGQMPKVTGTFTTQDSSFRYDLAAVPRDVTRYTSDQNWAPYGDVMDLPQDLELIDVEDHGTNSTIGAGGPAGPSTTVITTLRSSVRVDADPETGLGASVIGGDSAAPNVETFAANGVFGDVGDLFRAWRSLKVINCNRASWPGDLRGDNLIPPTVQDLGLQRHNLSYAPTEFVSWADDVDSVSFYTTAENHSSALWITDGVPQMQVIWEGLYGVRAAVNPDSTWNMRHEQDDREDALYCTATSPDQVWKMLGLGAYHPANASGDPPHNAYDAVAGIDISNMVKRPVATRVDSTTFRVSWSVPDAGSWSSGSQPADHRHTQYRNNSGTVEAYVRESGSNTWRPLFQSGEMLRLIDDGSDAGLYEITGHTYDAASGEVEVSVSSSPSVAGASAALPSSFTNATCVHGFYFQSQT